MKKRDTAVRIAAAMAAGVMLTSCGSDDTSISKRKNHEKLSTDYENLCGNCRGYLKDEYNYCMYCGTKKGEGEFKPYKPEENINEEVYASPIDITLRCDNCDYSTEYSTMKGGVPDYCPECGEKTDAMVERGWERDRRKQNQVNIGMYLSKYCEIGFEDYSEKESSDDKLLDFVSMRIKADCEADGLSKTEAEEYAENISVEFAEVMTKLCFNEKIELEDCPGWEYDKTASAFRKTEKSGELSKRFVIITSFEYGDEDDVYNVEFAEFKADDIEDKYSLENLCSMSVEDAKKEYEFCGNGKATVREKDESDYKFIYNYEADYDEYFYEAGYIYEVESDEVTFELIEFKKATPEK